MHNKFLIHSVMTEHSFGYSTVGKFLNWNCKFPSPWAKIRKKHCLRQSLKSIFMIFLKRGLGSEEKFSKTSFVAFDVNQALFFNLLLSMHCIKYVYLPNIFFPCGNLKKTDYINFRESFNINNYFASHCNSTFLYTRPVCLHIFPQFKFTVIDS